MLCFVVNSIIMSVLHRWDRSVRDIQGLQKAACVRQELALHRMFSAQRLRNIRLLSIYFSKWQHALYSLQIQSLTEANSGKKQSINQEMKARGFETLGRAMTNKNALRMARGLRVLQKAAQENMLDYEKILRAAERIAGQFALSEVGEYI